MNSNWEVQLDEMAAPRGDGEIRAYDDRYAAKIAAYNKTRDMMCKAAG